MINLIEVSQKIEQVLNDGNNPIRIDGERVVFVVATQGYRLDSNYNQTTGKNYIPVFVSLAGGENNPIPNLNQQSKSVQIAIYYPVKHKDLFYDLENYLDTAFVGNIINIGTLSGNCLMNLGIADYGEINKMNLQEFEQWVGNTYKMPLDITSNYMSMSITLYATTIGSSFMFGNQVNYKLEIEYYNFYISYLKAYVGLYDVELVRRSVADKTVVKEGKTINLYAWRHIAWSTDYFTLENPANNKIKYLTGQINDLYDSDGDIIDTAYIHGALITKVSPITTDVVVDNLVWSSSGTGASISPISQQLIDTDSYAKNVPNITNYNKSLLVYTKHNNMWDLFLAFYNTQQLEFIKNIKLTKEYGNGMKFVYNQLTLNLNENIELGKPLTFTITLGDMK